ncbi:MAG: hypothetical protein HC886_19925 [Leptolyngbyaceae cyanobacterium SM1_1_3]|nr:hypothetical protein [Leptolyngbyaceae cyanobacterium SM1_1_3]
MPDGLTKLRLAGISDRLNFDRLFASATDAPSVTEVYVVKPDILAIRIDTGHITKGGQIPYQPQAGDNIADPAKGWLKRNGELVGAVVGPDKDFLTRFDQFSGSALDTDLADQPNTYSVTPTDRSAAVSPEAVERKSKPTDMAWVGPWKFEWPWRTRSF